MRLIDSLFRQGHLSERAIVEAIMTGGRPIHLDNCGICAERAADLNRWLDGVQDAASEAADQAFPAERLAAQQSQILRRLEQLDEPARVIAFPHQSRSSETDRERRRVAPVWVGAAAAAGLVIGVIGGQVSARLSPAATPPSAVAAPVVETPADAPEGRYGSPFEWELDRVTPGTLSLLDDVTPTMVAISQVSH